MVKVFHAPQAGWLVELGGSGQPFSFPTKAQAIAFAISWAEAHEPNEVRVYGTLGDVERSMSFPNGGYRRRTGPDRRRVQVDIAFHDRRRQERRSQI